MELMRVSLRAMALSSNAVDFRVSCIGQKCVRFFMFFFGIWGYAARNVIDALFKVQKLQSISCWMFSSHALASNLPFARLLFEMCHSDCMWNRLKYRVDQWKVWRFWSSMSMKWWYFVSNLLNPRAKPSNIISNGPVIMTQFQILCISRNSSHF